MATRTLKPMTRAQWEKLPPAVQYFHPWERASQPLTIDPETRQAIEPPPAAKPARTRKAGRR